MNTNFKIKKAAKNIPSQKGFTLIELLVVIAIIVILGLIIFGSLTRSLGKADIARLKSEMTGMKTEIILWIQSNKEKLPRYGTGNVDISRLPSGIQAMYKDTGSGCNNPFFTGIAGEDGILLFKYGSTEYRSTQSNGGSPGKFLESIAKMPGGTVGCGIGFRDNSGALFWAVTARVSAMDPGVYYCVDSGGFAGEVCMGGGSCAGKYPTYWRNDPNAAMCLAPHSSHCFDASTGVYTTRAVGACTASEVDVSPYAGA